MPEGFRASPSPRRAWLAAVMALLAACASTGSDGPPAGSPPVNLDRVADAKPRFEPLHPGANNPYTVQGLSLIHISEPTRH